MLLFFNAGTKTFEGEVGYTINESVNLATQRAIEAAVLEMVREGVKKGYWSFESITSKGKKK